MSIDDEIKGIEEGMRVNLDGYWRDPALQRRYAELLRARDVVGPPPLPVPAEVQELAALERDMADRSRNSSYWYGPSSDAKQARYRELTARGVRRDE